MNLKVLLITFVVAYVLISLPAIFGIGFVIDWVPEATLFQKVKGYLADGLFGHVLIKIGIAVVAVFVFHFILTARRQSA